MVVNFPYPAQEGSGFERVMAFDTGYITYKNKDNRVLTIRKLDYGVPCIKVWSAEEIKVAYNQAEARRKAIEDQQQAQRELANARAAAEQAEIEAKRRAELAAIEAEKKAKIDERVENYRREAEKGVPAALQQMGKFYETGYGVERDEAKAREYFKKADEAIVEAEKRRNEDIRLRQQADREVRFKYSLTQANNGHVESMVYVGKCYRDGNGVEINLQKAREFFQKASDLRSQEAATLLIELGK